MAAPVGLEVGAAGQRGPNPDDDVAAAGDGNRNVRQVQRSGGAQNRLPHGPLGLHASVGLRRMAIPSCSPVPDPRTASFEQGAAPAPSKGLLAAEPAATPARPTPFPTRRHARAPMRSPGGQ